MAAPDVSSVCIQVPVDPGIDVDPLTIAFPGGFDIQAQITQDVATFYDVAKSLMAQLSSAIAPLGPILLVIKCVTDLQKCIVDVPKAITGDVSDLTNDTVALAKDIDALIGCTPPLSVPKLIKSVLRLLITFLVGLRQQLTALQAVEDAIDVAVTRAGQLETLGAAGAYASQQLMVTVGCSRSTLASQLQGLQQSFGPIAGLTGILNELGSSVGLDDIPLFPALDDTSPGVNITPLDEIISVLSDIDAAIVI
jgi:hypothetical protein